MDTKGGSVVFDRKDNDVYVGVSRAVESGTAVYGKLMHQIKALFALCKHRKP